ncbi:MAG: GFA family protein [Pseudomonadota bacterium]
MNTQTGSCLCGMIQYRFDDEPIATVHCHCVDCQRVTGSGFATVFGLPDQAVTITGEASIKSFTLTADSTRQVTRLFCANCGPQLFTRADNNPDFIWIKAGSLDDSSWLHPTDSCWTGSAASWASPQNGLTHHPGNP